MLVSLSNNSWKKKKKQSQQRTQGFSGSRHQVMASRAAYWDPLDIAYKNIVQTLENYDVAGVKLVGEAGIGKTWMAREICERSTSSGGSFYAALWLNLNKEIDEMSLYESIASQLSIYVENGESEEDDSDEEEENFHYAEEQKKKQYFIKLKVQITKKLNEMRRGKKKLLLVLDDEGSVTSREKVMKDLYLQQLLNFFKPLKILLTVRKGNGGIDNYEDEEIESNATDESHPHSDGDIVSHATKESHPHPDGDTVAGDEGDDASLDSHIVEVSCVLRDTFTDDYLVILLKFLVKDGLVECLEKSWGKDDGFLTNRIVEMSLRLPAAVVVLAKTLNCIAPKLPFSLSPKLPLCLTPKQNEVFKRALFSYPSSSDFGRGVTYIRNPILHLAYELLKTDATKKSYVVDCFWHSLRFFEHCGCVNDQELIAHWILEGYFDPVRSITKAYKDGYAVLMELINRGFLKKIQEDDNVVMPEVAMNNLIDLRSRGLSSTSRIRLAKVFGCDMTKGFGKVNQVDDIIEAVRGTRKGTKVTTVLVSGNRLLREIPESFFEKLKDLEILGLFQPTVAGFVPSLVKLAKLRVLVIRDCDLLSDIEELKDLRELHTLEVSGASSLKKISDGFFKELFKLQSLHLSGLQITSSPPSISALIDLHCLIIKDCPLLEDLPDIQELIKLEVVDVSGARGLQTCFDNTKKGEKKDGIKNKNFHHLTKLQQLLDLSESQIQRLPIFQDSAVEDKLHSVKRLLLRDCSKLRRLPSLKPLSGLQILDLSGTTSLVRLLEVCFEDKKELRILNMSGTNLRRLPSTIEELSNLNELHLRGCTNLEALPDIAKLTNLEVFDVSGCAKMHTIEGSFEDMSYLRKIDLSGTKVFISPKLLPKESKICCRKHIILEDGSPFECEDWSQVAKAMQSGIFEKKGIVKSQEISEMESREIQLCSSNLRRKRGISKECFQQFPIYRYLYQKSIPFVDSESHPKVLEIHGNNSLGGVHKLDNEALAIVEFVSLVGCSSARLTSIFNQSKSVKGCWLRMCNDVKDLFSGVDEERLESLVTLSVTNLPSLETISWSGGFKSLKELSIDCCPNIEIVFLEASQVPSSLEVLHVKYCEKLQKVFKEGTVSTLATLCLQELPVLSAVGARLPNLDKFDQKNCPKLSATKENLKEYSDLVKVDCTEALPQD